MSALDEILRTVDLLYAAALDRHLWPAALDRLADATGGLGTAVLSVSQMNEQTLASESLLEAAADYVKNEWWKRDILREESIRRGSPTGLITHRDVMSEEMLRRHPFFQEFWRAHGVGGMASYSSIISPGNVSTISIQRGARNGDFEAADLRILETLGPHAARALRLGHRIADAEARATSMEAVLDRFTVAALLVDRRRRVLAHNKHAEVFIGRGCDIDRGTLQVSTSSGQRALDELMKATFEAREAAPKAALISTRSGAGILAQAFAVPHNLEAPFGGGRSGDLALVVLTQIMESPKPAPIGMLRTLGLTPAEARVASLIGAGFSPAEAADALGIKVSTVRVEMKSIFAKLGLHRQSELASLVARLTMVS